MMSTLVHCDLIGGYTTESSACSHVVEDEPLVAQGYLKEAKLQGLYILDSS